LLAGKEVQNDLQRKAERLFNTHDTNHKPGWQKESADAAYALAMFSGQGVGGIQDWDITTHWLQVAAEGGCMRARADLPRVFASMDRNIPPNIRDQIHEWLEEAILLGEDRFAEDTLERLDAERLSNTLNLKRKIWSLGGPFIEGTLWGENWDEAMTYAWEDYASYSGVPDEPRNEDETQQAKWIVIARQAMDDTQCLSSFIRSSPQGTTTSRAVKEYGGGLTWLHLATNLGMIELVKIILEQTSVDIDSQDWDGRTALFFATISGNATMANFLLDRGANAGIGNDNLGNTCLHFVSSFDHGSISGLVKRLVESGGDVNAQNTKQETSLHTTLKNPISAISSFIGVRALLECHADPCIPDMDGDRPHMWAATYHQPECLRLLLSSSKLPANELSMLKAETFEILTLQPQLERKALAGDKYLTSLDDTISLLLDEDSVELFKTIPDNGGDSVMYTALSREGIDLALAIVRNLPFVNIDEKEPDTKSPVIKYAIRHGKESVFRTLVSLGADIFYRDSLGENVFHVASEYSPGMLPCLFEIAEKAGRVTEMISATSIDGATPFDKALTKGNLDAAKLFIAHGANFSQYRLRAQDKTKTNILGSILGLPSTSLDQVFFLLDLGLPAIVTSDGSTVFHAIGQINNTSLNEGQSVSRRVNPA
jgi:ankyrin repeat protein